jgi:hypothetical protein
MRASSDDTSELAIAFKTEFLIYIVRDSFAPPRTAPAKFPCFPAAIRASLLLMISCR